MLTSAVYVRSASSNLPHVRKRVFKLARGTPLKAVFPSRSTSIAVPGSARVELSRSVTLRTPSVVSLNFPLAIRSAVTLALLSASCTSIQ
jgi:hypothetical protein